jgi:hypothetical protein
VGHARFVDVLPRKTDISERSEPHANVLDRNIRLPGRQSHRAHEYPNRRAGNASTAGLIGRDHVDCGLTRSG